MPLIPKSSVLKQIQGKYQGEKFNLHSHYVKRYLDRFSRFAVLTEEVPYIVEWVSPFPLKIALVHGGSGSPSNTWFLAPARVHFPNDISIGSTVSQGSQSWQTDRQTDHATPSVTIGLIYVVLRCGLIRVKRGYDMNSTLYELKLLCSLIKAWLKSWLRYYSASMPACSHSAPFRPM